MEHNDFEFDGIRIKTEKNPNGLPTFYADQPKYLAKLRTMAKESTFDLFRSVLAAFIWLSYSRPNICCAVNHAVQVNSDTYSKKAID